MDTLRNYPVWERVHTILKVFRLLLGHGNDLFQTKSLNKYLISLDPQTYVSIVSYFR